MSERPGDFKFKENIYGDAINRFNGARSVWQRDRTSLLGRLVQKTVEAHTPLTTAKTRLSPRLFEGNKLICSSDGEDVSLLGRQPWAAGSVIMEPDRRIVATFGGMIDPSDLPLNEFTQREVLPAVLAAGLEEYPSRRAMLNGLWTFWNDYGGQRGLITIADHGYPVEGGLFGRAQMLNLRAREDEGPNPIHEVATRLRDAGMDPDIDRRTFAPAGMVLTPHNPVHDSIGSGCTYLAAGEKLHNALYLR
jgi:hypothetical protein